MPARSARQTRAPARRIPPRKPGRRVPAASAARAASARPSASLPTRPYTAGPQELWPTPAAPHSAICATSVAEGPGAKMPPCCGGEPRPGDPLDLGERGAEAPEIGLRPAPAAAASAPDGRPARPPARRAAGAARRPRPRRRRSGRARPRAPRPRSASCSGMAKRASSGAISSAPGPPSPLHDEAAQGECPGADGRAPAPVHGARQRRGLGREARAAPPAPGATARPSWVPEPSPLCARDRAMHGETGARRASPWWARNRSANASARSASGPWAVSSRAGRRLEQQRRRRDRGAQSAEPAAQRAAEVEHPEMEPRRRPRRRRYRDRTYSVSIAIASCSRGPGGLVDDHLQPGELAADLLRAGGGGCGSPGSRPRAPRAARG